MPKALRLNQINSRGTLTVKELAAFLSNCPSDAPVVLKCGKNFRLGKMTKGANDMPVLVGKRSALR